MKKENELERIMEYRVRIVIEEMEEGYIPAIVDSDYLGTFSERDIAEDYLQWATGKILRDEGE